MSDKCFTVEPN